MIKILPLVAALVLAAEPAWAMHITEGLLPLPAALFWFAFIAPFLIIGVRTITRKKNESPSYMPLLGIFGAAVFVFSSLPIPIPLPGAQVTAHPAGTGLSALILGPFPSVIVAFISLLLQALMLAHGGPSTLGANTFSMGVLGSFAGILGFKIGRVLKLNTFCSGFIAGVTADLFTYIGTSVALTSGLATWDNYPDVLKGIVVALSLPVSILMLVEGFVTGGILLYIQKNRPEILRRLGVRGQA